MDINALLDEVKLKLDVKTDYRLSKMLDITEQELSDYRKGKRVPDAYACFKFSEVLGKAPSVMIAQIQAENARSERKRLYFKRFFSIAGLWIVLGAMWPNSGVTIGNAYAAGNEARSHKAPLCEMLRRFFRRLKTTFLSHTLRVTGT